MAGMNDITATVSGTRVQGARHECLKKRGNKSQRWQKFIVLDQSYSLHVVHMYTQHTQMQITVKMWNASRHPAVLERSSIFRMGPVATDAVALDLSCNCLHLPSHPSVPLPTPYV